MKVQELIKKLQEFPQDTEVRIFDWRKNLYDDNGDGTASYSGIYSFDVSMDKLSVDELEYYKEMNEKDYKPWVQLSFENEDYSDDGDKLDQAD